jgi:hypothetical protein
VLWCWLGLAGAQANLTGYDAAITNDAAVGLVPLARLTNAVTVTGGKRAAFNFGNGSGSVTMEFILEGNPAAGVDSYLAVGSSSSSNLRYAQYSNTRQLGFTQLGVADYLFTPGVSSPTAPTHVTYTWDATGRVMSLYTNGVLAGKCSGVVATFAMPSGLGWLGANPGNTEQMSGTIYRVTVYKGLIGEEAIRRHGDAYNDIKPLPVIAAFKADPEAIFSPGSAVLSWDVRGATGIWLEGTEVMGQTNLAVSPASTTTYTLMASNTGGTVTAQATVLVDPLPRISSFTASETYIGAGGTVTLSWSAKYGQAYWISPDVGDVTGLTVNGAGSLGVQVNPPAAYTLVASNAFGVATAQVALHLIHPAGHVVISEFMAEDRSILADENGDYSGWIEVFNPTAGAVNLWGYYLTDDETDPSKWGFPALDLAAGGYVVVFASGKDRANAAGPLHANFQLHNAGEYLALVGPGPRVLQAFTPAFPPQWAGVAYGLLGGDLGVERYFGVPTPGAANNDSPAPPGAVQCAPESRIFTNKVEVTLATLTPGATIRYTLDGSVPSATRGTVYSAPLVFTNTKHLRAVALANGLASRLSGAAYLKLGPDLMNYTSPLPIMVVDNFGAGAIPAKGWNSTGAGIQQVHRQTALWATIEREQETSAFTNAPEMIHTMGIRGRGAASSGWTQKPYSVDVWDEQGEGAPVSPLGMPAHTEWILYFPDGDTDKDPVMMFNTFAYQLGRDMGHYAARYRWVEAFINEDGGDLRLADRRGVYAIVEKMSRGKDRLDFEELSADGTTGGWELDLNRMDPIPEDGWPAPNGATQPWYFHTAGPNRIPQSPPNSPVVGDDEPQQSNGYLNFDDPSGYNINAKQRAAIEGWFKQFEDVLWNNALWRDPTNGYRKYIHTTEFADYFIVNVLTHNGDGLLISLYPWKGADNKLHIGPVWDYNWSTYYNSGATTGDPMWRSEQLWYERLFTDSDFKQLYIDRWWFMRQGPMSNAAMDAIIDKQMADITPGKSVLNGVPSASEWTNRLGQFKTWLKTRADAIDGNYVRPPAFNVNGGQVPDGFQVVMGIVAGSGTIYYTLDGSDPRAPGGTVAAGAQAYQGPVPLQNQTLAQARVKNGVNWSGLTKAVFYTPQDLSKLAITELMYNPPPQGAWRGEDLEFLELKNTGAATLHLGAMTFASGINFTFTNGTELGPGQFFVLARNAAAFPSNYPGAAVNGIYSGKLDNAGETLRLATAQGNSVLAVTFQTRTPWPLAADGYGFSLVPVNGLAPGNSDNGTHWRASAAPGGSPGADDPSPTIPGIVINEVLTRAEPPARNGLELYNPTAGAVDLGGWFISDDGGAPRKFQIPQGAAIPAGGYMVFTEADFNPTPATLNNFILDAAGGSLYLCSGDGGGNLTGYSHSVTFGAAGAGVSFGRYVNRAGEEHFPAQQAATLGAPNAGPVVGPVVIQEIHYHPSEGGLGVAEEFLELRNISAQAVPLYDPAYPTNTWRVNGFGFDFPTNLVLPANGLVLIVATNPAVFRDKYGLPADLLVLGPATGTLQDSGERLELQRPELWGTNVVYITVDEVRYNDKAPWPPGADGGGPSLQRKGAAAYGTDPLNWEAAMPTPGAEFVAGEAPWITSQPQSQVLVAYQDVTFGLTAAGQPPLYYQWLFDGDPITGATNASLLLARVRPEQAGAYQAIVYNAAGSAASAAAQLTTLWPAVIQQHPLSLTTNAGKTVTFSVSALGAGALRYQWRLNDAVLPGATNKSLTITNVQPAQAGNYTVVVTDNVGPAPSNPARLVVLVDPTIVQGPLSQGVVAGGRVTLSVTVTNTATLPLGYRWRRNGSTITGAFYTLTQYTSFFTITNAQWPYTNYTVYVTNQARPSGILSAPALLTFLADADGDGLPDAWEAGHGFDPTNALDGALDADGDGMSNGQEYAAGTDPQDPSSYLKLDLRFDGRNVALGFEALSNKTYSVQYTELLGARPWTNLAAAPARATNRVEWFNDSGSNTNRFYRLVTPRQN